MTIALRPPAVETDLARSYRLPDSPPDDVAALIEYSNAGKMIWERSRVDRHLWTCAASGTTLSWRKLVARGGELREHHLPATTVWVVRSDAEIPSRVWAIYSNEPAAIAAAGGDDNKRVHPWQVAHRPYDENSHD